MGIGFLILLIGAFAIIIAARGTYKYLPPWYKSQPPTPLQNAAGSFSLLK